MKEFVFEKTQKEIAVLRVDAIGDSENFTVHETYKLDDRRSEFDAEDENIGIKSLISATFKKEESNLTIIKDFAIANNLTLKKRDDDHSNVVVIFTEV